MGRRTRMNRKLEGHPRRNAPHRNVVDDVRTGSHPVMTRRGREHTDLLAVECLLTDEPTHLRLDTTGPRCVAVRDMQDPHAPTLPR